VNFYNQNKNISYSYKSSDINTLYDEEELEFYFYNNIKNPNLQSEYLFDDYRILNSEL
jgi:hypothetical protein